MGDDERRHRVRPGPLRSPLPERAHERRFALPRGRRCERHPAAARGAAARSRTDRDRCPGRARDEAVQEPARPPARLAASRLALLGPREGEVDPGPGDPDVEQPALLLERRVVVERLADRQRSPPRASAGRRRPTRGPSPGGTSRARRRRRRSTASSAAARRRSSASSAPLSAAGSAATRSSTIEASVSSAAARSRASSPLGRRALLVPQLLGPHGADRAGQALPGPRPRPARRQVDRGSHLRPPEEPESADPVGDPGPGQRRLDRRELGVRPDEHGDLRRGRSRRRAASRIPAASASELRLGGRVTGDRRPRAGRARRGQPLRAAGARGDEPVREVEDLRASSGSSRSGRSTRVPAWRSANDVR